MCSIYCAPVSKYIAGFSLPFLPLILADRVQNCCSANLTHHVSPAAASGAGSGKRGNKGFGSSVPALHLQQLIAMCCCFRCRSPQLSVWRHWSNWQYKPRSHERRLWPTGQPCQLGRSLFRSEAAAAVVDGRPFPLHEHPVISLLSFSSAMRQ